MPLADLLRNDPVDGAYFNPRSTANYARPEDMGTMLSRFNIAPEGGAFNLYDPANFTDPAEASTVLRSYQAYGPEPETPPTPANPVVGGAQQYADFVGADPFELPDSEGAMQGLRALQGESVQGYRDLIAADPNEGRQDVQDAMYELQREAITRDAADLFRRQNEATFGRGVGLSTISTENTGRLARETNDSLARAGLNALIGSGAESRANTASRLGVLGAGFGAGSSGLQGEANVGMANAGREQQANQFALNTAFQESQAALNRAQQGGQFQQQHDLATRAMDINERNQQLAALGLGAQGLATLFGPALNAGAGAANDWLINLFRGQQATG